MAQTITLITPVADRSFCFALTERWMAQQTIRFHQWIVADDGDNPLRVTMGQTLVRHEPRAPGVDSFCGNLLAALHPGLNAGDIIIEIESDEYYAPNHLETVVAALADADIAGTDHQPYYHLPTRRFRVFDNFGAMMNQTALRRELLDDFRRIVRECRAAGSFGVDAALWRWAFESDDVRTNCYKRGDTVVGVKGLPGRTGLGVGHRPDWTWASDPDFSVLKSWIGRDADLYIQLAEWRDDLGLDPNL